MKWLLSESFSLQIDLNFAAGTGKGNNWDLRRSSHVVEVLTGCAKKATIWDLKRSSHAVGVLTRCAKKVTIGI